MRTLGLNGEAVWAATCSHTHTTIPRSVKSHSELETAVTHQSFTLLYVLLSKQKLSVEVRQVNGVQIEERDFSKTCQNDIFH